MVVPSLDKPNLAGIWQAVTPANFDIQDHQDQPGVPAPYQPWARDKQKYIEANLNDPVQEEFIDPQARCLPDGPSARRSLESEFAFAGLRWIKLDIDRIVTIGRYGPLDEASS